ncbi:MAG: hypothetical protein HQK49_17900 [Oligoflexia bacterium]|nr:hypothetical protein [Oligoflexia bacterium]
MFLIATRNRLFFFFFHIISIVCISICINACIYDHSYAGFDLFKSKEQKQKEKKEKYLKFLEKESRKDYQILTNELKNIHQKREQYSAEVEKLKRLVSEKEDLIKKKISQINEVNELDQKLELLNGERQLLLEKTHQLRLTEQSLLELKDKKHKFEMSLKEASDMELQLSSKRKQLELTLNSMSEQERKNGELKSFLEHQQEQLSLQNKLITEQKANLDVELDLLETKNKIHQQKKNELQKLMEGNIQKINQAQELEMKLNLIIKQTESFKEKELEAKLAEQALQQQNQVVINLGKKLSEQKVNNKLLLNEINSQKEQLLTTQDLGLELRARKQDIEKLKEGLNNAINEQSKLQEKIQDDIKVSKLLQAELIRQQEIITGEKDQLFKLGLEKDQLYNAYLIKSEYYKRIKEVLLLALDNIEKDMQIKITLLNQKKKNYLEQHLYDTKLLSKKPKTREEMIEIFSEILRKTLTLVNINIQLNNFDTGAEMMFYQYNELMNNLKNIINSKLPKNKMLSAFQYVYQELLNKIKMDLNFLQTFAKSVDKEINKQETLNKKFNKISSELKSSKEEMDLQKLLPMLAEILSLNNNKTNTCE